MCGIVGMLEETTVGDIHALTEIEAMLATVAHRGPDAQAVQQVPGATMGHARLAIVDLKNGAQPMRSHGTGDCIVYNGEIYNHRSLRKKLPTADWQSQSDTETLLSLCESDMPPEEWLPKLEGMFAFAVQGNGRTLLARDSLGIKPLYMGTKGETLFFASEIKALVQAKVESIEEFPPGHYYTNQTGLCRYFSLDTEEEPAMHEHTVVCDLSQHLTHSVRASLTSDVPVGAFLSGGLDSSLIVALASCLSDKPLTTFAVGMEGSEDILYARIAARHLKTDHHERLFTLGEALAILPEVIWHLESFDVALVRSALPNYFLAHLASKHVKVALSGEGADELFAGYSYLQALSDNERSLEQQRITNALHHTNFQRCDRMSMAHGLEVRVPFLDDPELLRFAFRIPQHLKVRGDRLTSKWILREAGSTLLPSVILHRPKVKFGTGVGLSNQLATYANKWISDTEFKKERQVGPEFTLSSKEELLYFRIFSQKFPVEALLPLIGRTQHV